MRFVCHRPFVALIPVIGGSEPKAPGCDGRTTICFFTFAATLFGPRATQWSPCGAVVSGHEADEIGPSSAAPQTNGVTSSPMARRGRV